MTESTNKTEIDNIKERIDKHDERFKYLYEELSHTNRRLTTLEVNIKMIPEIKKELDSVKQIIEKNNVDNAFSKGKMVAYAYSLVVLSSLLGILYQLSRLS